MTRASLALDAILGSRNMSDWKTKLDAFVRETKAFVEAVRSQRPMATEAFLTQRQPPVDVPEHFRQPVPNVSEPSQANEPAEQPRLEPMRWGGSEREEIRQRIGNFKAHQQRFILEREDYARSTVMRLQGTVTAPRRDAPKRKA
jgi:hypothetical protein